VVKAKAITLSVEVVVQVVVEVNIAVPGVRFKLAIKSIYI